MMGLAPAIGRQRAHEVVYDACREVSTGTRTLLQVLAEDDEVSASFTEDQLKALLDPRNYLGVAAEMVDRATGEQTTTRRR